MVIVITSLIFKLYTIWRELGTRGFINFAAIKISRKLKGRINYKKWIAKNNLAPADIYNINKQIDEFSIYPKFSIIIPVYNIDKIWLEKAIESVLGQFYTNWEICIADDASTQSHIKSTLTKYIEIDNRIKVVLRSENGNISAASNSALEIATGDYIVLLDHDDELSVNALFENAKLINRHPDADFIYSDEDKIDINSIRCDPFFKPDWSPDYFHSCMYTCHLGVYRTTLIQEIGGFRSDYDGAQDYDLVLRVVEKTKNIYHIPKILYHWRIIESSVTSGEQAKPWAYIAAQKSLEDMLRRSCYKGCVEKTERAGFWRIRRDIIGQPLISIIIPSAGKLYKSNLSYLERCVKNIQDVSTCRNFEIIVVDGYDINDLILKNISSSNLTLVRCSEPFNFSMRINRGSAIAKGDFLLLLNDDTEVISPDWLESMLEFAQQPEIGAVGAKLYFPNGNLQHAGVMVLSGNPCHSFYNVQGDHSGYFCSNIVNRNYLAVTGACLMMRRQLFEELEGMDENFPVEYNDVDLCLKAHQAGYRNVVTPYAQLVHHESVSREPSMTPKDLYKLNNKWENYLKALGDDPYYNPNLSVNEPNFEL